MTIHTRTINVDVSSTKVIGDTELDIPEQDEVSIQTTNPNNLGTTDPTFDIEVAVDGTWKAIDSGTATFDITKTIPEPKVRVNLTTSSQSGDIDLWVSAK